jgi:uncharacterized protein with HEPN domain
MQRDLGWGLDIVLACRDILDFTSGMTKDAFLADELVRSAVVRKIEVIGEATKRLSPEFRASFPDIPWQAMAGMRDRLIHGYEKVDWERVWAVVERSTVELLAVLEPIAQREREI